jgi:lactoylglutathione lyase
MHIEHIAIWTRDPERLRSFYETYFDAVSGPRYQNPRKQFTSYFLSFRSGARVEIMSVPALRDDDEGLEPPGVGYAHLAIAVGDESRVDALTGRLRADGYRVLDGPRRTGDGYYEAVIADPDGNRIEITA